ncbi:MAG: hypothetical protein GY846_00460, partial [Deltaproteobacteria bacterium]|nr:hypothetical protein [Deltaproteobacteria bacterium]
MNYADSLACHRCFKDKSLIEYIREEGKRGWCDWCGGRNVYVVPLYKLGDLFRDAVSIYKQNDDGLDSISFLFQEDWEVFSDKLEQDPDVIQGLTVAILTAGLGDKNYHTDYPDYDGYFRREESKLVEYWHEKAEAYFERGTDSKSPAEFARSTGDIYADFPDQLEFAFEELSKRYEPGKVFYRARIHRDRF